VTALSVIAYGGGVQSTAMVVLATQGKIDVTHALFCNVGDDSEDPLTLDYVKDVITPWSVPQDIEILTLNRRTKDGNIETIRGRLERKDTKSIPIPVYFSGGAPGRRSCTADFKIRVMAKWLKQHGASETDKGRVAIGISTDEYHRVGKRRDEKHEETWYPLIELGYDRADCAQIIRDARLPVPPKSACYFCPFHRPLVWAEMRRDRPALFEQAATLEDGINRKRAAQGKDAVTLSRKLLPLREAHPPAQEGLFGLGEGMDNDGGCDDGYCFV